MAYELFVLPNGPGYQEDRNTDKKYIPRTREIFLLKERTHHNGKKTRRSKTFFSSKKANAKLLMHTIFLQVVQCVASAKYNRKQKPFQKIKSVTK